ncbi:DedA family protein [Corynebacterium cystitidis]|uniref:Membrane protein DedA, SNARE-associated domain n=1 Tax=Corynebacterium cystitidis DSM 20524 TaxID=1121357 RepID=A0A1H9TXI8_9CORY|nr:DedA family protein [Corynebacterium cystitidis]WJY81903.1 Inner membrane protein YqjA [Corynebacterium cystitidis DSM 20524]SES01839.1 membrane protein DedA, SNARE-associated domain [Corynebacterium cystitidis DSM 20524]SNV82246.1 membrane protein [Corynebacterium cystitidis]
MQGIIDWIVNLMEILGAPGVGIAILLENVFPPIPSEVVLPLAGFTVAQGSLNMLATFIWATAGSVVGAYLLYGLGAWLGADRLRRIADKMWLVDANDVDSALHWFDKYGAASVFFGRLIPGVRSLISIPAGIDRMNLVKFGLWTLAGSGIWNALLIYLGYLLGDQYTKVADVVDQYSNIIYIVIAVALIALITYLIRRNNKRKKSDQSRNRPPNN